MQIKWFTIVALTICLSACVPSVDAVSTEMAQTQAAQPTSTLIPFSSLDLETILMEEGDLPAGYSGGQPINFLPDYFFTQYDAPVPDYNIYQDVEFNGGTGGFVGVFVYENQQEVEFAYQKLLQPQDSTSLNNVGDKAKVSTGPVYLPDFKYIEVMVIQCHALIVIEISETDQEELVINYTERLIKRLIPLVCR
jgi:hypothetical protein